MLRTTPAIRPPSILDAKAVPSNIFEVGLLYSRGVSNTETPGLDEQGASRNRHERGIHTPDSWG